MTRPHGAAVPPAVRPVVGSLLVYAGVMSVVALDGPSPEDQVRTLIPLGGVVVGLTLLIRRAGTEHRGRWLTAPVRRRRPLDVRSAAGILISGGALVRLLNNGASTVEEVSAIIAASVLCAGAALIALPYLLRVLQDLGAERAERVRAQEFAEVAAHMHDSVLHVLALIQRADPADAPRLARTQERELRAWLYDRRRYAAGSAPETFATAVRTTAAEVEDRHGVRVEVVTVGDTGLDDDLAACLAAAREALVNAAKYAGGAPISLFAEVDDDAGDRRRIDVSVRDRGPGFDLHAVGADRMGIRESIVGRMARHGGRAEVRTAPGAGTEVRLELWHG